MSLEIEQFICGGDDNFAVIVHDPPSNKTLSVDAPDGRLIAEALRRRGWGLDLILVTHHHGDHTAGIEGLQSAYGCEAIAPEAELSRIPGRLTAVREGDVTAWGDQSIQVIETPGHSIGHVSFHLPEAGIAFVGDTLFSLGCGRVPEGNHAVMWRSLEKLAALPPATQFYCGHEYTVSNSRFALSIEPGNEALQARARAATELRAAGKPSLPATIGEELAANPFLRATHSSVKAAVGMPNATDSAVFTALRQRKDRF
ncbi:MAG: hydroxyacylglutathione hydrolase [Bauldia sp.]|nr:hydroxyacylglutathione hydrolase [Bauldia sp.]